MTPFAGLGAVHRSAILSRTPQDSRLLVWDSRSSHAGQFDAIIVGGEAAGTSLSHARTLLDAHGTIYLHNAQRPEFDEIKQSFVEHGVIGPCEDVPGPHLWYGGPQAAGSLDDGTVPVIVSYFTSGTPYEALAARLRASCEALGLRHHITPLDPVGSWEANCAAKAQVCLDAWHTLGTSIVWVDADAIMRRRPQRLASAQCDFAIHKWAGWKFASGTAYFGHTPLAEALLTRWVERCRREPRVWDQVHLDRAWEDTISSHPLHTMWLPRSYCQVFDAAVEGEDEIVVEHFQASRELKQIVTNGASRPRPEINEALCKARRASRPVAVDEAA